MKKIFSISTLLLFTLIALLLPPVIEPEPKDAYATQFESEVENITQDASLTSAKTFVVDINTLKPFFGN